MSGHVPVGVGDEFQRMQGGVRDWVHRTAGRGKRGLHSASPPVLLSLLCASAFCPLLMATGVAGAGIAVLSSVGGGFLNQVISDALDRLRKHNEGQAPSREDLETGIAQQIQQVLASGDEHANALRGEIASVLKEIDAGGTALRAAMEQTNERVRSDVIAAIGVLGSDFSELGFLIRDVAQAAAEIQKSLDVQGANVRVIIEQNVRQSTDIRLVREDLAVIAERTRGGMPDGTGRADGVPRWVRGCPYRGLLPFNETDAEVFYGRERLAAELAVKLAARVSRGGLVVVTGASGAGKSSLLRAGLLPILAQGQQVQGSDQWPRIVMTPTKDPLTELAARLAALGGNETVAVRDGLVLHPDQAHLAVWSAVLADAARHDRVQSAASDSAARLVLIVDQFEQVFTLNPGLGGEAARQAFVTALWAAATTPVGPQQEPPALVVMAVRGDFWDRCAAYPELVGALQDGQFVVGPMTESEFRVAITGPADAAGLGIDPALTDTILSDLRVAGGDGAAGVLPLLSQAMSLTWEKREADRLTSHGYSQAGGVSHAVQTGADKVYDALPAGQQALAREVLRSMTVASRDGRLTRRPLTRADLYSGLPGADPSQVDAVLEAFAAERLVVLDAEAAQISHDVLLRAWPKLRAWLEEDQASWIVYGQLADAATAWHDSHDDSSFLYRGSHLTALQQAATRWSANPARYPALTSTQRDFLHASERAATRSSRQRRGAVALLAVLALLSSAASVFAFQQGASALRQRNQAIYNQIIAESDQLATRDTPLAALLTLIAYHIRPTRDVISRLLSTENAPLPYPPTARTSPINSVAFSRDGRTFASGGSDGTVRLWNAADPTHPDALGPPLAAHMGTVFSVAFSPDGYILASGSSDAKVRLWNVADPAHPHALGSIPMRKNSVRSVAFSPDGRTLASGNNDGVVRLWDVANPVHPHSLGPPLAANGGTVFSVAFSPDGRTLASGSFDGMVRLWDVSNPVHPRLLGPVPDGPSNAVNSVAFSSDGLILASGSFDGTVRLWDVADPAHPHTLSAPLTANTGTVLSVAFSPDGRTLASGANDGTTRLWSLPPTILIGPKGTVTSVAFRPGGRTLASASFDGAVRLWDVANPAHPHALGPPLTGPKGRAYSVAFSPDGRTLAVGSGNSTVRLWDVANPARAYAVGRPWGAGSGDVLSVAFSPNGRTLAIGSNDNKVRLWQVANPAQLYTLGSPWAGPTAPVSSAKFSPDGRTLAVGSYDDTVRLLNVTNPAKPSAIGSPLTGPAGPVEVVAFNRDGSMLASGSDDDTIQLWDVKNPARPRALGPPLAGHTSFVYSVAFSPRGSVLASGSNDETVRLWNLNIHYAIQWICSIAGKDLTSQQWHKYIPQLPYQPPCNK